MVSWTDPINRRPLTGARRPARAAALPDTREAAPRQSGAATTGGREGLQVETPLVRLPNYAQRASTASLSESGFRLNPTTAKGGEVDLNLN